MLNFHNVKDMNKRIPILLLLMTLIHCCYTSYSQTYYGDIKIKERNVLDVQLNANNKLLVNGRPLDLADLKLEVKQFMNSDMNYGISPEVVIKHIPSLGDVTISKGVVLFCCYSDSFDEYMKVIDEFAKAFTELRDEMAWRKYRLHWTQLDDAKKQAIRNAVPIRVAEFDTIDNFGVQLVDNDVKVDDVDINNRFIERYMIKVENNNLYRR